MCEIEGFEVAVRRSLDSLEDYASQLCYELAMPLDGRGLCELVNASKLLAAREDPCLAERFTSMPEETQRARLMVDVARAAHRLRRRSGVGVDDSEEQERAMHILRRVKDGVGSRGRFALAVCLSGASPEEMGRNWLREGLGPLREAIEQECRQELGSDAWASFERLFRSWREAEQGMDQSDAEGQRGGGNDA